MPSLSWGLPYIPLSSPEINPDSFGLLEGFEILLTPGFWGQDVRGAQYICVLYCYVVLGYYIRIICNCTFILFTGVLLCESVVS